MQKTLKIQNLSTKIYFPDKKPDKIVIGVHGFSGDKESSVLIALGKALTAQGVALVTFDLPCHGENISSSPLRLSDCVNSLGYIFKYVRETYKDVPISLFATSFGAYLSLLYLNEYHESLDKIILRAPAIYMEKVLSDVLLPFNNLSADKLNSPVPFGYGKTFLLDSEFLNELANNNLENTKTINNFLYILQGKQDDIVNPDDNSKFFNKFYPNQHKIIYFKNADHRFKNPGELERIISETLNILI